ncbi:Trp biosynthesis-associated membrane protein [Leifsonia sp. NPDC058230]|uniref:Trp biosynthesis-associated membrane protein n=1 Tax=Leifsonia sp. NPDC058230 TaxID=3346391 RepID=UPI0036D9F2AE
MAELPEPEPAMPADGEPEVAAAADRRVSRRAKYLTILVLVIGSGLVLLASTQSWFSVVLTPAGGHTGALIVQGSAAAPALTALSLAGLALAAALAIAGPVFRIVLAVLGLLLGASVLLSAFTALGDPVQAASSAITSATGVSGDASIARLVARVDTQVWPSIAIVGGFVLILGGVAVLVTGRLWPGASKRYETRFEDQSSGGAGEADAAADADASDDAEARAAAENGEEGGANAPAKPLERDTAIDSWDELSRGDDPTR